jgi:porin
MHDKIQRAKQRESLSDFHADYMNWKARVEDETNVAFSMDVTLLAQWGFPDGGSSVLYAYATPSLDWTVFKSNSWGTGSVQMAYNLVPSPTARNAANIQSNLGLITPINDLQRITVNLAQLSYTQATPDNRWLITAGQYPLYNFDGNAYLGNQQQNFNNYLFAQNGSQTHLTTGLGASLQLNATSTLQFAAGFQGTNNVSGKTISANNFSNDCCGWFAYVQWTPHFRGLGSAQYSLSYFDTPSIASQSATRGWSVNAVQNLNETWAVFGRANGANGFVTPIKKSYALGAAINNPLKRTATDQIALAVGLSVAASPPTNPSSARNEIVLEAYWTWTFGGLLLTPSVQYISHPALNPTRDAVWVGSLRATLPF